LEDWKHDAISLVRKAGQVALETEDSALTQRCAEVVLAMKSEGISVPPELFAYALVMDELIKIGALKLRNV